MVERSDAAILEGARLHVSQPHGWGISMSKSGEFQMSVNTGDRPGRDDGCSFENCLAAELAGEVRHLGEFRIRTAGSRRIRPWRT